MMGHLDVTAVHLLLFAHLGRIKTLDEGSMGVQISHRYVVVVGLSDLFLASC